MRLYVATKEGTVLIDDLPQEATSRDLTSRVLAYSSPDGEKPASDVARHYLVRTGWYCWLVGDRCVMLGRERSMLRFPILFILTYLAPGLVALSRCCVGSSECERCCEQPERMLAHNF